MRFQKILLLLPVVSLLHAQHKVLTDEDTRSDREALADSLGVPFQPTYEEDQKTYHYLVEAERYLAFVAPDENSDNDDQTVRQRLRAAIQWKREVIEKRHAHPNQRNWFRTEESRTEMGNPAITAVYLPFDEKQLSLSGELLNTRTSLRGPAQPRVPISIPLLTKDEIEQYTKANPPNPNVLKNRYVETDPLALFQVPEGDGNLTKVTGEWAKSDKHKVADMHYRQPVAIPPPPLPAAEVAQASVPADGSKPNPIVPGQTVDNGHATAGGATAGSTGGNNDSNSAGGGSRTNGRTGNVDPATGKKIRVAHMRPRDSKVVVERLERSLLPTGKYARTGDRAHDGGFSATAVQVQSLDNPKVLVHKSVPYTYDLRLGRQGERVVEDFKAIWNDHKLADKVIEILKEDGMISNDSPTATPAQRLQLFRTLLMDRAQSMRVDLSDNPEPARIEVPANVLVIPVQKGSNHPTRAELANDIENLFRAETGQPPVDDSRFEK